MFSQVPPVSFSQGYKQGAELLSGLEMSHLEGVLLGITYPRGEHDLPWQCPNFWNIQSLPCTIGQSDDREPVQSTYGQVLFAIAQKIQVQAPYGAISTRASWQ